MSRRLAIIVLAAVGAAAWPAAAVTAERHPCEPVAKRTIQRFADALGAGRAARAERRFAPEPAFEWYSTGPPGERFNAASMDRASLRGYFRTRIAAGERIAVKRLRTAYDRGRDLAHFHGTLRRSADDLSRTRYSVKGAATCAGEVRIVVWSMAPDPA